MNTDRVVSWFSAGVSSAVATKMLANEITDIIYIHIDDQHPDTLRFVKDCEQWFQNEIQILQSDRFKTVEEALLQSGFVRSPDGAPCTGQLKKAVRKRWEAKNKFFNYFRYVWGMDVNEADRAERIKAEQWEASHSFPLIDFGMTKNEAHGVLASAGIRRPAMYELGYLNNNCVGCVKGGMSYWNKIREDFPDVFERRAKMERLIGGTSLAVSEMVDGKKKKVPLFLDELDPKRGRDLPPIVEECGVLCGSL